MPNLFIDVEARFAKFQDSLDALSRNAGKSVGQVDRAFSALKTTLATVGATVSVAAFTSMVRGAIDAADKLNDLSKKTGIAADTLGGLGFAAQQAGGNLDSFSDATTKLNRSIAEAGAGSKEKVEAFNALGISVTDGTGRLKSADAVMLELATKFESYADGPNKVAIAIALLGKAGADQIPVLNEGGEKLRQNIEYYKRFSGVTQKVVEDADQFNDTLVKLRLLSGALGTKIASELLPTMQGLADHMLRAKEESDLFATSAAGVKTVLQGLTVFGANVAYVFQQIGVEIAGIGLQLAALAKLDFKEFKSLGDAMKKQAAEARKSIDDFSDRILGVGAFKATARDLDDAEAGRARFPGRRLPQAPGLPDAAAKKEAEDLKKLYEEVRKIGASMDISVPFIKNKEQLQEIKKTLEEGRKGWIAHADAVFADADAQNTAAGAGESFTQLAEKTRDRLLDLIDPLRAIKRENEQIDLLVATGWMTEAQAKLAKLDPAIRALLQPLDNLHEKIQKAWEGGLLTTEEMQRALLELQSPLEKNNDLVRDLGLTFTSAFEDAISGGKKLSDVLKALEKDIIKIVTRKLVTEPLGNAVTGALKGTGGAGGFLGWLSGLFGNGSAQLVQNPASYGNTFSLTNPAYGHTGGIVGSLGRRGSVDAGLFTNAPRFHGGGLVSGERPIIAKVGEGIFTPQQMAALSPAGGKVFNITQNIPIDTRGTPFDRRSVSQVGAAAFEGARRAFQRSR